MPTLPSVESMGQRRTPQARRGVVQVDGNQVNRAAQQAGEMLTRIGGKSLDQAQNKSDRLELARAKSYWLQQQIKTNGEFENDQDYATMEQRYGEKLVEAKTQALGMLRNPESRALFEAELELDYVRGVDGVKGLAYKREVDSNRAVYRQTTEENTQALLQASDPKVRDSIFKTQGEYTKALRDKGFLSAEEYQRENTNFMQNYAVQRATVELQNDPKGTLERLKPKVGVVSKNVSEVSHTTSKKYKGEVSPSFLITTAAIETGGTFNPQSFNKNSKAAGMWQITPDTGKALKVKDPFNPEEAADGTARLAVDNARILRAKGAPVSDANLYLAHQQGGPQAAALLKNPDENVVDVLADVYGSAGKARAAVVQNGGDTSMTAGEFSGKWIGKYKDFEAKYAGMPVRNTEGVQVASLDGGPVSEIVPAATPTSAGELTYFEKTGDWVDFLPYDKRASLINAAETQLRQERVVNRQLLDIRVKDASSMAMQGFEDTNPPSYEDFDNAYDGPEAELRWREYQKTQKIAGTIHQAATMTPTQQVETLLAMKPKPGPGFADEQQNYETLQKAMNAANTARKDDPIAFAQQYKLATGEAAEPLSMDDPAKLATQLRQRGELGTTMNQQYATPLRVFTESEATSLGNALNGMTANDRLGWLDTVQQGLSDNPQAYVAALGQLRPGSATTAYAGTYLGLKGSMTTKPWFGAPVTTTPQAVASMILQGEDLINPPKDSEGKEVKAVMKMPSEKNMRQDFDSTWGPAFANQPQAAQDAYKATLAYYAAQSAKDGSYSGEYDADRFEIAMKAVMGAGDPVSFGNSEVVMPWGMEEDQFRDAAKTAFDAVVAREQLRTDRWNFGDVSLVGIGRPGEYVAMVGTTVMPDKEGNPIVLRVDGESPTTSRYYPNRLENPDRKTLWDF